MSMIFEERRRISCDLTLTLIGHKSQSMNDKHKHSFREYLLCIQQPFCQFGDNRQYQKFQKLVLIDNYCEKTLK